MKRRSILKMLVLLVSLTALSMIIPLIIAVVMEERGMIRAFGISIGAVLVIALPVLFVSRKQPVQFNTADGCLLVFLTWVAACLQGALPFFFSGYVDRFADAAFESISGFTTTGISVFIDLDILPRSLIFWRAETHWLGGMGMVVLTVAILPLLGVGGFQLLKAESPGPDAERITPKIAGTAKFLWISYMALTGVQVLLLRLCGMSWFDAMVHAFSTLGTGGFSSRNESIAYYQSPAVEWVCTIFMLIGGYNYILIYRLLRGKFRDVLRNSESRAYVFIILISVVIISAALVPTGIPFLDAIRQAFFSMASILTTTGFSSVNINLWPPLAQGVLFILMFIGGCSGSTAGGVKIIRYVVLWKQAGNELRRIIYPKGVFTVRLDKKVGRKDVVYGVAGFVFLYFLLLGCTVLLVSASGLNLFSSVNVALITLGNIGQGLGLDNASAIVYGFPSGLKWALSFIMIAGRLELWTAFVLFSRDYWR
ncbi:MAG: TrkH family potassium uptake protein [Treponema sp.]|jgi:trk system potassium uptake protein TrkH|nr:TrkH family potassium uptake protein [Treponema sp.]